MKMQCTHHINPYYTDTRLTALCPGLPRWAGTRKVKLIWILLKQETVSGSGISWAICKSAHRSRQITTPAHHTQFFTGRMPFLPPSQQCQSTEGNIAGTNEALIISIILASSLLHHHLALNGRGRCCSFFICAFITHTTISCWAQGLNLRRGWQNDSDEHTDSF